MKNNTQIQKLVLAASLTAVSVVIDAFFRIILNIQGFGLPFYAIPLIIGGIVLGPLYAGIMGFVGDAIGIFMTGGTYMPFFVIAAILWGVIPGLLLHKRFSLFRLAWVVVLTYVLASTANTVAMLIYWPREITVAWFVLRMTLIPFNSIIIFMLVKDTHKKLIPFFEKYTLLNEKAKAS
jgi:ECF transporter S component (folate family)